MEFKVSHIALMLSLLSVIPAHGMEQITKHGNSRSASTTLTKELAKKLIGENKGEKAALFLAQQRPALWKGKHFSIHSLIPNEPIIMDQEVLKTFTMINSMLNFKKRCPKNNNTETEPTIVDLNELLKLNLTDSPTNQEAVHDPYLDYDAIRAFTNLWQKVVHKEDEQSINKLIQNMPFEHYAAVIRLTDLLKIEILEEPIKRHLKKLADNLDAPCLNANFFDLLFFQNDDTKQAWHKALQQNITPFMWDRLLDKEKKPTTWTLYYNHSIHTKDNTHIENISTSLDGTKIILELDNSTVEIYENQKLLSTKLYTFREYVYNTLGQQSTKLMQTVISANDKVIAGFLDGTIKIWDVNSGEECIHLSCSNYGIIKKIALVNDKIVVNSLEKDWSANSTTYVYDIKTGKELFSFKHNNALIHNISSYNDKAVIAYKNCTPSSGDYIGIWNIETGKCAHTIAINTTCCTSHPIIVQDKIILHGNTDIKIWDINTAILTDDNCLHTLNNNDQKITAIAIGNGKVVAGFPGRVVKVWDVNSGDCTYTINALQTAMGNINLAYDKIVIHSSENMIEVYDLNSGKNLIYLSNPYSRHKSIISNNGTSLIFWENDHNYFTNAPYGNVDIYNLPSTFDTKSNDLILYYIEEIYSYKKELSEKTLKNRKKDLEELIKTLEEPEKSKYEELLEYFKEESDEDFEKSPKRLQLREMIQDLQELKEEALNPNIESQIEQLKTLNLLQSLDHKKKYIYEKDLPTHYQKFDKCIKNEFEPQKYRNHSVIITKDHPMATPSHQPNSWYYNMYLWLRSKIKW